MFPIRDFNRSSTTPHINRMLIITNVSVFLVMSLSDFGIMKSDFLANIMKNFAMPPYYIVRGERLYTLFTSMFLHAGFFHLFGNMLYLYIFGDNVEDVFGHAGHLVFYIVCGLVASFAQIMSLTSLNPNEYVLGASGAISGVLGAYIVLYPKARVLTLVFYGWPIIMPIPAVLFLGFWFLMQWLLGFFDVAGGVAYWAHVGGFIAGVFLALVVGLKRKKARDARLRL